MEKDALRKAISSYQSLIPPAYQPIVSAKDSLDALITLSLLMGGSSIYIPRARSMFAECIEQDIRNRYNGFNLTALALDYGYTPRYLRSILSKKGLS